MLALVGAAAALFLFWILPGVTTTRAAASRHLKTETPVADEAETPTAESEVLMAPPAELVTDGNSGATQQPATSALVGANAATAASEEKAKIEGPKLQYEKGHGKAGKIEAGALRAEQREKRKERLAKESAEAAALGTDTSQALQAAEPAVANPNRDRIKMKGGKASNQANVGPGRDPAQPQGKSQQQQAKRKQKKAKEG